MSEVEPCYDVILALGLTKWIHLNWGDAGLRRSFQKIYHQLRFGGVLILEAQPFSSYSRRKKLTPTIAENYKNIAFFPRDFHSYPMSREVGFTIYRRLGRPQAKKKGFDRPLDLYTKTEVTSKETGSSSVTETGSSSVVKTGSSSVVETGSSSVVETGSSSMVKTGDNSTKNCDLESNSDATESNSESEDDDSNS